MKTVALGMTVPVTWQHKSNNKRMSSCLSSEQLPRKKHVTCMYVLYANCQNQEKQGKPSRLYLIFKVGKINDGFLKFSQQVSRPKVGNTVSQTAYQCYQTHCNCHCASEINSNNSVLAEISLDMGTLLTRSNHNPENEYVLIENTGKNSRLFHKAWHLTKEEEFHVSRL